MEHNFEIFEPNHSFWVFMDRKNAMLSFERFFLRILFLFFLSLPILFLFFHLFHCLLFLFLPSLFYSFSFSPYSSSLSSSSTSSSPPSLLLIPPFLSPSPPLFPPNFSSFFLLFFFFFFPLLFVLFLLFPPSSSSFSSELKNSIFPRRTRNWTNTVQYTTIIRRRVLWHVKRLRKVHYRKSFEKRRDVFNRFCFNI